MHHIMFDVDGTLVDSYDIDSQCFIEAIEEVVGIQISSDWSTYEHVTDSGILKEILSARRITHTAEAERNVKRIFLDKLEKAIAINPVREILGASSFISLIKNSKNVAMSIATGGWHESAELKLHSAGLDFSLIPLVSSSETVSRIEIMKLAALRATGGQLTPCTYFGDGSWDKKACEELGYNFILVGNKIKHTPSILNFESGNKILTTLIYNNSSC